MGGLNAAHLAFGTYGPRDAPPQIMALTYDEGEIQPEQRVAHLIIYPLVFAAVAAIILTVIITKMSPMHMGR